jgi:hypothetical protein
MFHYAHAQENSAGGKGLPPTLFSDFSVGIREHCTVQWLKSWYLAENRFFHPNIAEVV